ncbi:hypothetical protein NMY22_g3078 [Coprinellus aureogranulatus]|nr:hypothetical protein NMY22_g3078 [Coprinellus aureogranulatus]
MKNNLDMQKDLDVRIAQLQLEILDLKRRRNELSLISSLPADIMTDIFSFSLTTLGPEKRWKQLPDFVRLSHVSRAWRAFVLDVSGFWALMQIRKKTSPELLVSQMRLSKEVPLIIEYYNPSKTPQNLETISKIIRGASKRLRSLSIYGEYPAVQGLLSFQWTPASALETLEIHDIEPFGSRRSRGLLPANVFSGSTPNLRRIVLSGYTLPWTSSILASPHLTHLEMGSQSFQHDACRITRQFTSDLLLFLSKCSQLKTLRLEFPGTGGDIALVDVVWTRVELPSIEELQIRAADATPVVILLPRLSVNPNFKILRISVSGILGSVPIETAATLLALRMACSTWTPPQQISLTAQDNNDNGGLDLKGWRTSSLSPSSYPNHNPIVPTPAWITLRIVPSKQHAHGPPPLLIGDPTELSQRWWFCDVRTLFMHNTFPAPAFWATLATLPHLEFLSVSLTGQQNPSDNDLAFFDTLQGKDSLHRDGQGDSSNIPFPSLCTLQISSSSIPTSYDADTFLQCTLHSLLGRRSRMASMPPGQHPLDLGEVAFVNSKVEIVQDSLESLLLVSEKVTWHTSHSAGSPTHPIQALRS